MSSIILAVICFLILANLVVWTLATVALHTKKGCQKSHYFWCDSGWECCSENFPNCSASKTLPQDKDLNTKAVDSYKLTDRVYGTDNYYYQGCIQPMNALLAALKPGEDVSSYSLNCIYCTPTTSSGSPPTPDISSYKINDSNGGSTPCTVGDCKVPEGFKYQNYTCSTSGGCNDSNVYNTLVGACAYLPFEDIPKSQNNSSTGVGTNWLPFYPDAPTTPYPGYSQNSSGNFFAPGASNAGQYNTPAKWNYAPASGGPTLPTALFSARNRMNNTWAPLGTTNTTAFRKLPLSS